MLSAKCKSPLISIIIPIYNSEKFLNKCIDSVICQSYKNIQIILINDGSTDNSQKICEEYLQKDSRIIFINKENNQGTMKARQSGIKLALGKFIMFVDSDDYIKENAIATLIKNMSKDEYDILIFNFEQRINQQVSTYNAMNIFSGSIDLFYENILSFCSGNYITSLCNKLYKSSLLKNNNVFNKHNILIAEDLLINVHCFKKAKTIKIIDDILYTYNKSNTHSVTSKCTPNFYKDMALAQNEFIDLLRKNCKMTKGLKSFIANDMIKKVIYAINKYIKAENFDYFEKMNYLKSIVDDCKNYECFNEYSYSSLPDKEVAFLIRHKQYSGLYYYFMGQPYSATEFKSMQKDLTTK